MSFEPGNTKTMTNATAVPRSRAFSTAALVVIVSGAVIVSLSMGVRQAFGILMQPVALDLGIGREAFGFAIALQNLLWGAAQPFIGAIADRWGAVRVTVVGAVLYAAGLVTAAMAQGEPGLIAGLGLMIGVALSMTTYVTVLGAVGRAVPAERRGLAFGITTAAGSFGMFIMVPGLQGLIDGFGWRDAMMLMALGFSVMVACAVGLRTAPPAAETSTPAAAGDLPFGAAVRSAAGHGGYWLLTAGFFVCGFHVTFIATHLPAYLADNGLVAETAAFSLALIGFFNILGSLTFGRLGDRYRKKRVLSWMYMARAVVIGLFLLVPLSAPSALVFSAAIGFLWLGTVPLTSGVCAQIFGVRALSTLYGFVFFSHQVGSFLGAWMGGVAYDILGSYEVVWLAAVILGVVAAVLHWPIDDRPVTVRPATREARA